MRCDECAPLVMDRLRGELPPAAAAEVERHLAECAGCAAEARALGSLWRELGELPEPEASPELRGRFHAWLEEEREALAASAGRRTGWLRRLRGLAPGGPGPRLSWAAATLAAGVLGLLAGSRLGGPPGELRELRSEVRSLSHLVTLSMLQQDSASDRLQGVSLSRLAADDPRVIAALLDAVAQDPSVNVRLAAIDALAPAAGGAAVRARALAELEAQPSPLVQIALVDLVLRGDGAAARAELRRLLATGGLHPAARAHLAERLGQRA